MNFDDLVLNDKLKLQLEPHREVINLMLKTCRKYDGRHPSRATLYRWAQHGIQTMTPRMRFEKRKIDRESSEASEKEQRAAIARERYKEVRVWAWHAWRRTRDRAAARGLDFNITPEDLMMPEYCPVLGLKLKPGGGRDYQAQQDSPSVDRIDNSKGYVKGNVAVISKRANSLKSDSTAPELARIVAYMLGSVPKT